MSVGPEKGLETILTNTAGKLIGHMKVQYSSHRQTHRDGQAQTYIQIYFQKKKNLDSIKIWKTYIPVIKLGNNE